jgi:hypothetical protein
MPLKHPAPRADYAEVEHTKAFDPSIMEQFAEQLLRKADSVRVGSAVVGGVLGVIFGAVPLTPLASVWPIPAVFGFATILLGLLAGVLVGYVVGEGRAFRLRVQAQTALFQVDIEKRLESALTVQARLIAAALTPVPAAAPAPVPVAPAPAPVAPPPLPPVAPDPTLRSVPALVPNAAPPAAVPEAPPVSAPIAPPATG